MTHLSVNINKIATLRNARGGNEPNLVQVAKDCEKFGAQGITVHPRPDERHIRYQDVLDLRPILTTEFNMEGNPNARFVELVGLGKPAQVTLVPDAENALTSNAGWDCIKNQEHLKELVVLFKSLGCRVSIFVDAVPEQIRAAKTTGADRVELYTESYAKGYAKDRAQAIAPFVAAAKVAHDLGLGLNAGHDLNLDNLRYFHEQIPFLDEVSIGHALICDALYLGLEKTIQAYRACLN